MNKKFLLALILAPGLASAQGMNQDCMQNMQKAQAEAMTFGKEVSSRPALMKMRECMELMRGMMPETPYFGPEEGSKEHVCDS